MSEELPVFEIEVERPQALVRASVRLGGAALCALVLIEQQVDVRLLWLTDRASFLALGLLAMLLAFCGLWWLVAGVRWLTLALWPGIGIRVTPGVLEFRLGPFGERTYPWSAVRLEVDESIDPDLIEQMPDDAFVPKLWHAASQEDLTKTLLRFGRIDGEGLTRLLRPYIRRGLPKPG